MTVLTPRRSATGSAVVFCVALLMFSVSATEFGARVTDISALRILGGEVPYRDFWTMYAPGSFTTLAIAFALFGREMLVSNILGILAAAGAVAMYYRLARVTCGLTTSALLASLVAVAFFGTGYHQGFTSYPPAFLLILAAVLRAATHCTNAGIRWAIGPGLLLGAAALFKHDIAAYAAVGAGLAVVVTRYRARVTPVWTPAILMGTVAAAVVAAAAGVLIALGAGRDLWLDVVQFPSTDFPDVRPERFPIVPRLQGSPIDIARELILWATCNFPSVALVSGLVGLWGQGRRLQPATLFIIIFAFVSFWLHWFAAHVQINTHAISLTAWGALIGAIGLGGVRLQMPRKVVLAAAIMVWWAVLLAETTYTFATDRNEPREWIGLPQLAGIRTSSEDASWMRQLSRALEQAEDPTAPLLLLSNRNDVHVFAEPVPYWLTARRPATRHHELHPGITDTDSIQRQMLASLSESSPPVVVREHRFSDEALNHVKADHMRRVAIGATVVDEWLDRYYEQGPSFGPYQLMRRRLDSGR